jgi:hypothetical protein
MRKIDRDNPFIGYWRITDMELWDQEARDLVVPAHVTITADGDSEFQFIAVIGFMDCIFGQRDGLPAVEFSWQGEDESDEALGRGWAVLEKPDLMRGRIFFHHGDNSAFTAARGVKPGKRRR